jgi:adenine-specific DNA-methyltransferase
MPRKGIRVVWESRTVRFRSGESAGFRHDKRGFICYAKNKIEGEQKSGWIINLLPRTEDMAERYKNPDNDIRGIWTSGDVSVKTYSKEYDYPITTPSGKEVKPPRGACWLFSKEKFQELVNDNRIWFGEKGDNVPRIKRFLSEVQSGLVPVTIWLHQDVGHNQQARQELKEIFSDVDFPFETPKPVALLKRILQLSTDKDSIILDSFAGSGTTAHAVLNLNKEDSGNRKFILVECEEAQSQNPVIFDFFAKNLSKHGL